MIWLDLLFCVCYEVFCSHEDSFVVRTETLESDPGKLISWLHP